MHTGQMVGNGNLEFMNILNNAKKERGQNTPESKGLLDQAKEGIASVTSNVTGEQQGLKVYAGLRGRAASLAACLAVLSAYSTLSLSADTLRPTPYFAAATWQIMLRCICP